MSKKPTNSAVSIELVRDKIDGIDSKILRLVNQRIEFAKQIGGLKQAEVKNDNDNLAGDSAGNSAVIYRPEREAQVIRRLIAENKGDIAEDQINILYRELMSICRGAEAPMRVAVLGPEGTFSELAALQQFGSSIELVYQTRIDDVFHAVDNGLANYGVVPVENSSEGVVSTTADLLSTTPLSIAGEIPLPIHQSLLSQETDLAAIKVVYSHTQSLSQCRAWLQKNLPKAKLVSVASNAQAARLVSGLGDDKTCMQCAAIAGEAAATQYGLNVLASRIEDIKENTTRFLVLSKEPVLPSGKDKTSLLMSCKNEPGSLFALLKPLHDNGISMLKIESRPSKLKRWEYLFFIDIEGHRLDVPIAKALAEVEASAEYFRVLGAYPRADLIDA